jgi:hypothetical protein
MKILFTIFLLPIIAMAQSDWKEVTAIAAMGLVAGIADGQREVIQHNKWAYRDRHPKANENWWNPDSTFKRANGTTWAGGTVFAWTKDKYHLNQAIRQSMFLGQTTLIAFVQVGDYKKHGKFRWGKLLLNLAIMQGSYMMAKGLTHKFYQL